MVFIFVFIQAWGNYMWPLIVAPNPQMYTVGQVTSTKTSSSTAITMLVLDSHLIPRAIPETAETR